MTVATTTLGVAQADISKDSTSTVTSSVPSAVEDFIHPNATQIETETGAVLKHGDGHIVFMKCDGSEDIQIESAHGQNYFCFRLIAKPAFLALEIPKAYGIWTTDDPVKATVQKADGTSTVINAPAGKFTGYGEAGEDRERTTLIELRVAG
ncbi:hypothetical protein [Streptomyces griseus]|uniref:hypothetical protein n=1 Tax=Streptomyces griseus TaxID=1911 RepID=UPI0036C11E2E